MKCYIFGAMLVGVCAAASAACIGSGSLYTCSDDAGNAYTVSRMGSTTTVNGSNPSTGSLWSQQSSRIGDTTITTGQTNGRSWNSTTQSVGGMTIQSGSDSRGRPFSKTCTAYGCF